MGPTCLNPVRTEPFLGRVTSTKCVVDVELVSPKGSKRNMPRIQLPSIPRSLVPAVPPPSLTNLPFLDRCHQLPPIYNLRFLEMAQHFTPSNQTVVELQCFKKMSPFVTDCACDECAHVNSDFRLVVIEVKCSPMWTCTNQKFSDTWEPCSHCTAED
jgi:hypothetical protein